MKIFCQKLQREAEQLPRKPVPGALGTRIFEHISQEAWELWVKQQTLLINEYQLSVLEPEAQAFLRAHMEAFLFDDAEVRPQGYTPPQSQ